MKRNVHFNSSKIKSLIKKGALLAGCVALTATLTGCNRGIFDFEYGLDKALITGDDTAIILDIGKWKDYKGEQIQIITPDRMVLLTSSFDTNCFFRDSQRYSVEDFAQNAVTPNDGEVYDLTTSNNNSNNFNKTILDTRWTYNKATIFNKNNALILDVQKWRDYEGEQLQVVTKDGMVLLLNSYNSKLIYDKESQTKALDFAKMYVGSDGQVTDLSEVNPKASFNYDIIDLYYDYNKAIIIKDDSVVIYPIESWRDYEGEQLQIKIVGGPTMLTAAYDTILLNDSDSVKKAYDIAKSLCGPNGKVINYANNNNNQGFYNRQLIDLDYGFSNAIISNDGHATSLPVAKWNDYEGEQLQIITKEGDIILTSSMFLDLLKGGSSNINASTMANDFSSVAIIDKSQNDYSSSIFNKTIIDTKYKFKYALKVENGNITIIPLKNWKDYYPSGDDDNRPTNCEQFQLELPDGTVMITTAYDTILVDNVSNIQTIASYFIGKDGVITDLTSVFGSPQIGGWNFKLFDTKYTFNYAIFNAGETSQIIPITKWYDYDEGEQVQVKMPDNSGFLSSYVNTSLIYTDKYDKVVAIAEALSGETKEQGMSLVKKYK